jgi:hypothetical protein
VLIWQMSTENPFWGAPRIHGELLKLGVEVAQSSVAKYTVKRRGRQVKDGAPFCVTTRQTSPPVPGVMVVTEFEATGMRGPNFNSEQPEESRSAAPPESEEL